MPTSVHVVPLDGEWILHRPTTSQDFPALVPGCVHLDLRRAGEIPPMDWRDDEATQQWIDAETWIYRRSFELEELPAKGSGAELVCEGLDTIATVKLNGQLVMEADNMFRTWRNSVTSSLRLGKNDLEITFHSTLPVIAAGQKERPLREWNIYFDRHAGRGHVRKMGCSYGWDWGPVAPTAGIWKSIRLEWATGPRWKDVYIRQCHGLNDCVLEVAWESEGTGSVILELSYQGEIIASGRADAGDGKAELKVPQPKLWWPNGWGEQPLYHFTAILESECCVQDRWTCRLGLRALCLVREPDAGGESFVFEVNGRAIFCKGANWVPHRILLPEITRDDYVRLIGDAALANMNMLRVWGGGIYEQDDFYEVCDELGILVWQDFAFACGSYPTWNGKFMDNVREEARDNVRRLRHHPSLALWCGNNELEGAFGGKPDFSWEEYARLFDQLLPGVCRALDPDTPYWPGSPHSPAGDRNDCNNERSGDAHLWSVFFGHQSFESQRTWRCRFMSEYGFQSFPELRTFASYTAADDRTLTSYISDYHQRSEVGNKTIFSYLLDWFQPPADLENLLIATQLTQSLCVRYAAEHLRRLQPHCAGVLYWQINDIWPCASWSSIDSWGRWKAAHYEAVRFFAPVLVSIEEDTVQHRSRIHLSNQLPETATFEVHWEISDTDGVKLLEGKTETTLLSQGGSYLAELDATPLLASHQARDLMVWTRAIRDGEVVSRNWAPLARPKHLTLSQPGLRAVARSGSSGVEIEVSCERPALYVRLSLEGEDALFSDNFFHLQPSEKRIIRVLRGPGYESVRDQLRVHSLAEGIPVRSATSRLEARKPGYELQRKR